MARGYEVVVRSDNRATTIKVLDSVTPEEIMETFYKAEIHHILTGEDTQAREALVRSVKNHMIKPNLAVVEDL
jgi:hypothetical protein